MKVLRKTSRTANVPMWGSHFLHSASMDCIWSRDLDIFASVSLSLCQLVLSPLILRFVVLLPLATGSKIFEKQVDSFKEIDLHCVMLRFAGGARQGYSVFRTFCRSDPAFWTDPRVEGMTYIRHGDSSGVQTLVRETRTRNVFVCHVTVFCYCLGTSFLVQSRKVN